MLSIVDFIRNLRSGVHVSLQSDSLALSSSDHVTTRSSQTLNVSLTQWNILFMLFHRYLPVPQENACRCLNFSSDLKALRVSSYLLLLHNMSYFCCDFEFYHKALWRVFARTPQYGKWVVIGRLSYTLCGPGTLTMVSLTTWVRCLASSAQPN